MRGVFTGDLGKLQNSSYYPIINIRYLLPLTFSSRKNYNPTGLYFVQQIFGDMLNRYHNT